MHERYPSVILNVGVIYTDEPITMNITELAKVNLATIEANPDFRLINYTTNANVTLFNGTKTLPAIVTHLYDFGGLNLAGMLGVSSSEARDGYYYSHQ